MSTAVAVGGAEAAAGSGGKKKLLLLAIPLVLGVVGAGLWFGGALPHLFGGSRPDAQAEQRAAGAPIFVELPEMVANLNAGPHRSSFVKLTVRLELSKPADLAPFTAAQPRVLDLFQTYLREMRPQELRGSEGTYRLREALIARASLVAAPARVVDVLFTELLVQ